ncbi:plant/MNJ7-17 protein [Trifolium pratense]|uniref:Plant/MNJ7-17 protein n=1 Tax=Trifolium pratense TaxID=57577 RepID=A0A2K3NM89_TRIPR|nr:plant/MNJ7-17 protein [Trifolium pratense]
MSADLIKGFKARKLWFPCKYFCLNATSLTIIAVTVKLSVDLNTPMPHRHDQLAKLASSAIICTIMANSMPSLGVTQNKETMMNVMAMAILVITMIVNICIQFVTGVIYEFWVEHGVMMFLMIVLLMIMTSSALCLSKMKHYMELKYQMNEEALREISKQKEQEFSNVTDQLRDELMKFWMMAHTSSPQFLLGRSVSCTASGAFCVLSTLTLLEAMLRSYFMPWSVKFCAGECDYKWSTILILIVQVGAVGFGSIAPAFRWFVAVKYRCPNIGIVRLCKVAQYVSIYPMCWVLGFCEYCMTWTLKFGSSSSSLGSGTKQDLRRFILHLEGEEELVDVMMKENCDATIHWVQQGEKQRPKLVMELLEKKCSMLQGFKGVAEFDCDQILPLRGVEPPPYSWSLPIVTLASIIVALPNLEKCLVKNLISTLNEGLPYVKFIEDNIDKDEKLIRVRKAAGIVWLGADLYGKWLDVDLYKLSLQNKSLKETLETLAECAKTRITKTILLLNQDVVRGHNASEKLFEVLIVMISDILGACLTNLPHVISTKCLSTSIEEREDRVRQAVYILGKTKKIIEMLEKRAFPRVNFCRATNVEDWRLMHKQKRFCYPSVLSSVEENDAYTDPSKLRDICINIE